MKPQKPTITQLSERIGKQFMPPDHGDECWRTDAKDFTREEVAYLLWTQIAMISNDLKSFCGNALTPEMFDVLNNPRIPEF